LFGREASSFSPCDIKRAFFLAVVGPSICTIQGRSGSLDAVVSDPESTGIASASARVLNDPTACRSER
jgi:hypothetical protein